MEKVCLAWWRDAADTSSALLDALLPLLTVAVWARAVTVHAEAFEHQALRYGGGDLLLTALASVWVDSYQDVPELPGTPHGWLVCESVPQPYGDVLTWPLGTRSPGLSLVTLLDKPPAVSEQDFYRCWHVLHRTTTAECHPFTSYVRNEVARPLSEGSRSLRGIVTESAPAVGDFLDPHRFYRSGGDTQQLRVNQKRVFGEVEQFIDLDTIEVAPMTEYVVRRLAPTSP